MIFAIYGLHHNPAVWGDDVEVCALMSCLHMHNTISTVIPKLNVLDACSSNVPVNNWKSAYRPHF